jgi:TolA-binding protein
VLELGVHSGLVSVEGPLANDGVMLRGGQLLRIRRGEGEVVVREASSAELTGWFGRATSAQPGASVSDAARPSSPPGLSWSELLTEGQFRTIVEQAEAAGLSRILASADAAALAALADAARYTKNSEIAERALRAERERFTGSPGAEDAAFLLGQLREADANGSEAAEAWYERYLAEAPGGAYAAEALGRRMVLSERAGRHERAVELASEYLERYTDGTHEQAARALMTKP